MIKGVVAVEAVIEVPAADFWLVNGGEGGIRTRGGGFSPRTHLAGEPNRPLWHLPVGGGRGIRTHDGFLHTCFQDRRLKPLGHPSQRGNPQNRRVMKSLSSARNSTISRGWLQQIPIQHSLLSFLYSTLTLLLPHPISSPGLCSQSRAILAPCRASPSQL